MSSHRHPAGSEPDAQGLLADPDPDVRIDAVLELSRVPTTDAAKALIAVVENDPQPSVVAAAIGCLATMIGGRCESVVCRARDRFPTDPAITHAVTRALTELDRLRV